MTSGAPDDELRWFRGPDATAPDRGPIVGSRPPREVRSVVAYLVWAGIAQLVGATIGGVVLARQVAPALGMVVGAIVLACAILSFACAALLQHGSDRTRRFVAWPVDGAGGSFGIHHWVRERLRTRDARRWFTVHAEARAPGGAGRASDPPPSTPAVRRWEVAAPRPQRPREAPAFPTSSAVRLTEALNMGSP